MFRRTSGSRRRRIAVVAPRAADPAPAELPLFGRKSGHITHITDPGARVHPMSTPHHEILVTPAVRPGSGPAARSALPRHSLEPHHTRGKSSSDRVLHASRDRGDATGRRIRRRGPGHLGVGDHRRHEPARHRRPRPRAHPAARRHQLLHRLPPLVRGLPVRARHLHLGQRRRAARPAARLHADERRPAEHRLRGLGRRLGRRLRPQLHRRRPARPGRPEDHRHDGRGSRRGDRGGAPRQEAR